MHQYEQPHRNDNEDVVTIRMEEWVGEALPQDKETTALCNQFYEGNLYDVQTPGHKRLNQALAELYERQYDIFTPIELEPPHLDFLFQQYGIKRDERENRRGFNRFGNFAISYLEGLHTMQIPHGILGRRHWEHRTDNNFRALLVGCSSISSAADYFSLCHAINPDVHTLIADIDPFAVELAEIAKQNAKGKTGVLMADAHNIPLPDESVDFAATNFLVRHLKHLRDNPEESIIRLLRSVSRTLSPRGRFVMVESLDRAEMRILAEIAHDNGLKFSSSASFAKRGGILRPAYMLADNTNIDDFLYELPYELDQAIEMTDTRWVSRGHHGEGFQCASDIFDCVTIDNASTLIFEKN